MFKKLITQLQYRRTIKDLTTNISHTELMCDQLATSCAEEVPEKFDEIVGTIRSGAASWESTFRIVSHHIADLDPGLHRRGWEVLQRLEDLDSLGGKR